MTETGVTRRINTRFKLVREVIAELKKVNWLSKREVVHLTVLVLVVTMIMAVFLGAVDYGFSGFIHLFSG
ncbi:MAG: preprotein translocase subunit SecE [Chloroflexota bacterium]